MNAYHATTFDNARAILESGIFKKGTYFAFNPVEALKWAGPIVFEAEFDEDGFKGEPCDWQFWIREDIPISDICRSWNWDTHGVIAQLVKRARQEASK